MIENASRIECRAVHPSISHSFDADLARLGSVSRGKALKRVLTCGAQSVRGTKYELEVVEVQRAHSSRRTLGVLGIVK